MWEIFSNTETVLGFIGSIISVLTFLLALRVRKQVYSTLDRVSFRENYEALLGIINGLKDSLNANNFNPDTLKSQIFELAADLESRYSFFPYKVKKAIKSLKKIRFHELPTNQDERIKLVGNLIILANQLKKETI